MHALVGMGEHRRDKVRTLLRIGQVHPGVEGAKGIPNRKHRVVHKPRTLVDKPVQAPVAPVHVLVDRRHQQGVVERGVEGGAISFGEAFGLHPAEGGIPFVAGGGAEGGEGLASGLRFQIRQRPRRIHGRQRHLHLQRPVQRPERQQAPHVAPRKLRKAGRFLRKTSVKTIVSQRLVSLETPALQRLRQPNRKMHLPRPRPALRHPPADQRRVIFHPHECPQVLLVVVVNVVAQIQHQPRLLARRVGVPVHPHPFGRRDL